MKNSILFLIGTLSIMSTVGVSYAATQIGGGDDVYIDLGKLFLFDGDGDTYIKAISPDRFFFFASGDELFRIESGSSTITRHEGPGQLRIWGKESTPVSGHTVSQIIFRANDASGSPKDFGSFSVIAEDVAQGNYDASYNFKIAEDGSNTTYLKLDGKTEKIEANKPLFMSGNDIDLEGGNIKSNGDICIGSGC